VQPGSNHHVVIGHARAKGVIAAFDMAVAMTNCYFAFSQIRVGVARAIIMVPALPTTDRRFLTRAVQTGDVFDAIQAAVPACSATSSLRRTSSTPR
jgi:enoyl-CoA hydratase